MQIPSRERVDKLTTILKDPANKFDLRLKQVGLEYRSVAHIVARAESYVELLYRFQNKKKEARNSLKNAKSRISRQISQVEKTTGKNFSELPDDIKMSSFYKKDEFQENIKGNQNIRDYGASATKLEIANDKMKRMFKSQSKPKELAVEKFCRDMKDLHKESNKAFNQKSYQLIADLSNFFHLSKRLQNVQTIRKRFSRNPRL